MGQWQQKMCAGDRMGVGTLYDSNSRMNHFVPMYLIAIALQIQYVILEVIKRAHTPRTALSLRK